jgi:hypothetical protein
MVALYFLLTSICIAGGDENCFAFVDTGAPWATGDATADADADGEGTGLGTAVKPPETWLDELAGVATAGFAAVGCAAGVVFGPHAMSSGTSVRAKATNLRLTAAPADLGWPRRTYLVQHDVCVRGLHNSKERPILALSLERTTKHAHPIESLPTYVCKEECTQSMAPGRLKGIVTRPNLVRRQAQPYDAPILPSHQHDAEKGPSAGTLSLEARAQA